MWCAIYACRSGTGLLTFNTNTNNSVISTPIVATVAHFGGRCLLFPRLYGCHAGAVQWPPSLDYSCLFEPRCCYISLSLLVPRLYGCHAGAVQWPPSLDHYCLFGPRCCCISLSLLTPRLYGCHAGVSNALQIRWTTLSRSNSCLSHAFRHFANTSMILLICFKL
jgi:hypothetical protein